MKFYRIILLLFLLQSSAYAVTLTQAVEHTLQTNPQMQKNVSDYIAIQEDLNLANAGYRPTLDFNAAIGEEQSDKDRPGDSVNLTRKETQLIANQNLFEGFGTKYDLEEQEARINASRYGALQSANTIALRTTEVYIQVLQQKKILDLLLVNVRTHERIYKMIKEKADAGLSKLSDLEQTHGRLALAYANYISQQNNYQDTLINFERVYGRVLSSSDLEMPSLPLLPGSSQAALIHIAQEYSPTLIIERSNIKTIQSRYEKEKSNFYPKLDLELSGQWNEDLDGVEGKDESYKAMLKLNYNLYNGGSDEAIRIKNLQLITSEQELLNEQERAVIEKIKLAYMAEHILKNQIRCLRIHANQTRKTADAYAQEYQLGRRTLLDLLNTELEYNSAQQSLENAVHDHLFSRYRVLEATGILSFTIENSVTQRVDVTRPESFINEEDEQVLQLVGETDEFIDMDSICKEVPQIVEAPLPEIIEKKNETKSLETVFVKKKKVNIPRREYIYFDYRSSEARSVTPHYIDRVADLLHQNDGYVVVIKGHTDNVASSSYNTELSQKRADFVKRILLSKGVKEEKIKSIGMGEDYPIVSNARESGRRLNRRVEINIQKH